MPWGKFTKKRGKVNSIKTKFEKIYVDGIQVKKLDGSKINVPLKASNLQIVELNLEDKKRAKKLGGKVEIKKVGKEAQDSKTKQKMEKKEVKESKK